MPEDRSKPESFNPASFKWPEQMWRNLAQAETQHLSFEQLAAYVDSQTESSEGELVRAHTDLCAQCAAELHDLRDFSIALKTQDIPKPVQLGALDRIVAWFKIPRHAWAFAGSLAVLALVVALPLTNSNVGGAGGNSETAAALSRNDGNRRSSVEAVLEPKQAQRGASFEENGRRYRVLTQEEFNAYQAELSATPDDPVARGALAVKFSLFGEAEKEYRKLEMAGGTDSEKGRLLLEELDKMRGQ